MGHLVCVAIDRRIIGQLYESRIPIFFLSNIFSSYLWMHSLRLSPFGVFFLVVSKLIEMESLAVIIGQLGWYFLTVMLGLLLHGFGTIALIFFICVHKLPYGYLSQMGQVLATAFGTGSRYVLLLSINELEGFGSTICSIIARPPCQ